MSPAETNVAKAIKRLAKMSIRYNKELIRARDALGDNCSHPPDAVEYYKWEHDNGYGLQTNHFGKICNLCLSRNPYPNTSNSWKRPASE